MCGGRGGGGGGGGGGVMKYLRDYCGRAVYIYRS